MNPPRIPAAIRRAAWERDGKKCRRCETPLPVMQDAWTDRIDNRPLNPEDLSDLRTLCCRCFVLRVQNVHRYGLESKALTEGVIDHTWRDAVWE